MSLLQRASEGLARKTSRRGLFGRGAEVATGALLGAAAGTTHVSAGLDTVCDIPGAPCPCDHCSSGGVCQKPCTFYVLYPSGCWVFKNVTCCDCLCPDVVGRACGCGSDYHNNPKHCP
jgi:hypothetical protein